MAIKKVALIQEICEDNLVSMAAISGSDRVTEMFKRVAEKLKEEQNKSHGRQLTLRVEDFLYAHCIMMHAAEASLVDQDTGEMLLNKSGEKVRGGFEATKDAKGRDTIKWSSPDGILPYRNQNLDIFPEEDLIKAHKEWIGRPLCKDHVSDSIDGVRGIIVDTYYDPKFKRVHAFFALDRKNYGELARKVEAGYATSVSMGTAVGRSICTECSNVATVESEFCHHVKTRTCHGEINKDLNPLELSIVVTGADPKAKIMTVLAALNSYKASKGSLKDEIANVAAVNSDFSTYPGLLSVTAAADAPTHGVADDIVRIISILNKASGPGGKAKAMETINKTLSRSGKSLMTLDHDSLIKIMQAASSKGLELGEDVLNRALDGFAEGDEAERTEEKGNEIVNTVVPGDLKQNDLRHKEEMPDLGFSTPPAQQGDLVLDKDNNNEEQKMTFSTLVKDKLEKRKAYWLGTEEPTPGKPQYAPMGDADKIRDKEDKQMQQDGDLGGPDGMVPGDEALKTMLSRAEIEARRASRNAWLKEAANTVVELKDGSKGVVDPQGNRLANDGKTAKKSKKKDDEDETEDEDEDDKSTKKSKKKDDEDEDDKSTKKSKKKDDEDEDDKPAKKSKKAYYLGTEEPTPGKTQYAPMGDADKIRDKEDKQMQQDGDLGGPDGMVPGDEALKATIHRASVTGRLLTHASGDLSRSKWVFASEGKELLSVTAGEAYGKALNDKGQTGSTYSEFFHSKDWGNGVRKLVASKGVVGAAQTLGIKLAAQAAPLPDPELPAAPVVDDVKSRLMPLIEKLESAIEDIKVEVEGPDEGIDAIELDGVGDASLDLPELPAAPEPAAGAPVMASRITDRDMLKAFAALSDTVNEICYIEHKYAEKAKDKKFVSVASSAADDAESVLNSVVAMTKGYSAQRRADAARKVKVAEGEQFSAQFVLDEEELEQVADVAHDLDVAHHGGPAGLMKEHMEHMGKDEENGLEGDVTLDETSLDDYENMTAAARAEWRNGLVKAAKAYDDVYESVRGKGGHKLENLGQSVAADGDKVEVLHETHKVMEDIATKPLTKVRNAAKALNEWVKAAGYDVSAVDRLVAEGAVDPAVAKYWKEYWGKEGGEKQYADDLVKDFEKKKASVQTEEQVARVRRAYAVGLDAQKKGMIDFASASLDQYVDTLVTLPDDQFTQIRKHVAMYKNPSHLVTAPIVGLNDRELIATASASTAGQYDGLFGIFS